MATLRDIYSCVEETLFGKCSLTSSYASQRIGVHRRNLNKFARITEL